ncbi:hypothetical protein [Microvirga thermotolerans]|uniref:Uncharacterized protein n=1 Tax=Microvirga thermotolerans TaxID=2651334 RepID=A0A5P9K0U4_9HYPH|nr:hypothetical protein [Microvirga thermotolerans]QFU17290.1 hypothetical protein GDR74_14260 [Microvirga thermotolerans]
MQESLEEIAYTLGGAVVSPGPGTAELVVALIVACGFLASALLSLFPGRHGHGIRQPRER